MTPAIVALEAAGIAHTLHEYERGDSLHDFGAEAADALGLDSDQVYKTLVVTVVLDSRSTQATAIVPVSAKLNLKAAAKALGAKRADMCDPAVAERITGYIRGGISPFGQKKQLPTVIDETATMWECVYVSGGKRGLDISVDPNDLVAALNAAVAPIADF